MTKKEQIKILIGALYKVLQGEERSIISFKTNIYKVEIIADNHIIIAFFPYKKN